LNGFKFYVILEKIPNMDNAIKELTYIAEMSLIIGLFLLTVGNFPWWRLGK